MGFDCDKLKHKCKAICCAPFPMEKELWERLKHKAIRKVLEMQEFMSPVATDKAFRDPETPRNALHIFTITEVDPEVKAMRCPFLTHDLKCNIYEDRPYICRKFGDESYIQMKCSYQAKDGRVRSRQETRALMREMGKKGDQIVQKLIQIGDK
jgi:Fe-S-cluster containining protein